MNVYPSNAENGYANTPTGRLNGFSYGGSVSIQRITNNRLLFGIDLGWESLESKEQIDNDGITTPHATGNSYLRNNFINCFPFAGYRFKIKNFQVDAIAGVEDATMLSSTETDKVTIINPVTITRKLDVARPNLTLSVRAQLNAWYRKWGIMQVIHPICPIITRNLLAVSLKHTAGTSGWGFLTKSNEKQPFSQGILF